MKKIQIKIKEKDKGLKILSLLNLREEVVNFLYKDTIANSTKADLQFFVLLFFVIIKVSGRTILEHIFDDALPKFDKLNKSFLGKKGRLRAGEYQKLVEENGLRETFESDIFFILIEAILNIDEIEKKFDYLKKQNPEISKDIGTVKTKYYDRLVKDFQKFQASRIQDDRYDETGNYHDLSKSVYRTVRMRNSRNFDLNLQKYTSVQEIISKSPIDFTFLQHIDPQIIFDLWDKYHLAEYIKSTVPHIANTIQNHFDFQVHLGDLVPAWIIWKLTNALERRDKAKTKQTFEDIKLKPDSTKALEDLTGILVKSVLNSGERLQKEIDDTKERLRELSNREITSNKENIKKLEERVSQLENITVNVKVIDDNQKI